MFKPRVFVSYSHADAVWLERLGRHLAVLTREGLLEAWDDRLLRAGDEWKAEIARAIAAADIAVLLVSAEFLDSNFIRNDELPLIFARRTASGLPIVSIILKPCLWRRVEALAALEARPPGDKTLLDLKGVARERALVSLAEEILQVGERQEAVAVKRGSASRSGSLTVVHGPNVPRQLPFPPDTFIGREGELALLEAAIRSKAAGQEPLVVCIRGSGGVGKSALALVLSRRVRDLFPDGEIYLDLRGHSPAPLGSAEMLGRVLQAYQPEGSLPLDEDELESGYRGLLEGRRALLLLDDAGSLDQVAGLVPPPGSLLLMTSRHELGQAQWLTMDLGRLPRRSAKDLLVAIAPRLDATADAIAQLCGDLPLALRLAAGSLAEASGFGLESLLHDVGEGEEAGLGSRVLRLSYEVLKPPQQARWRTLSIFPLSFDASAAASVWGEPLEDADQFLVELVHRGLLEGEDGRYRLHALARGLAVGQMDEAGREEAYFRFSVHFRDLLRRLSGLYVHDAAGLRESISDFDREWVNIEMAWSWIEGSERRDSAVDRLRSEFAEAGRHLFDLRLPPRERIRWRQSALEAARRVGDRDLEASHLGGLGLALAEVSELRLAMAYYEEGLAIFREVGDARGEGMILNNMGVACGALGDYPQAIQLYEKRLDLARAVGDRRAEGNTLGNLGFIHALHGDPFKAIEFFQQDVTIARELGNRRGEGNSLGGLGLARLQLGDFRASIPYFEQHLSIAREIGYRPAEGGALGNLGRAHLKLGETERAKELHRQQLAIALELRSPFDEVLAHWNLGLCFEAEGHLQEAADSMQALVDFERGIGHKEAEKHAAQVESIRARIAQAPG